MQLRRAAVAGVTAAALATLTACTSGAKPAAATTSTPPPSVSTSASASASPSPTPSVTTPPPPAEISLSGLPGSAGKPVIAVKIDNTSNGRPQAGLDEADIVYVEQVEGGITRLMAVFQSRLPARIGPVRSGRESDLEVLAAYGKVALAYSGAQPAVDRLIQASPHVTVEEDFGGYFFRDNSRYMPYNLYLDPAKLLKARPKIATARDIGLHFGDSAAGTPVQSIRASMSNYTSIGFTYDKAHSRWLESQDGTPISVAGGARVWTTNVLIQEVTVVPSRFSDVNNNNTPLSHTVGSGRFRLLHPDGTMVTGTWSRANAGAPTVYKVKGTEVTFAPGRTWILLLPKGNRVTTK